MPIYVFGPQNVSPIDKTTFSAVGLQERKDVQRLLRDNIEVVAPETLVISEEFSEWEDSKRRIDLLAVDRSGSLVVIEIKRNDDGGHMELQAIRYAAMVSTMTFERAIDVLQRHLKNCGKPEVDARELITEHLEVEKPEEDFAQDVRIVLVAPDFSPEITSSALWLRDHGIDVRCVRLEPHNFQGNILVNAQQIIPPPEAEEYQVKLRQKTIIEREARKSGADFTRYDVTFDGKTSLNQWKRNAIFLICAGLCDKGITPEEITSKTPWRANRLWYSVDSNVGAEEFEKMAKEKAANGGPSFNPGRWFCDEDQLIRRDNKTYAFSNQWGGQWLVTMEALRDSYPQFGIKFNKASSQAN